VRLVLWPDCAKGDYRVGSVKPVIADVLGLMADHPESVSGVLQIIDALARNGTRVSKSSLHGEALALAQGIERAEKVKGIFEEMYITLPDVTVLLQRSELGTLSLQLDVVTDAKSLYDVLTSKGDPSPSDEGVLLWAIWIRERILCGSVRRVIWTCTYDMLSDGLTKVLQDQWLIRGAQENGEFHTQFSCLCNGVLWEPWKGLPPPKSKKAMPKDEASALFLESYAKADALLLTLVDLGLQVQSGMKKPDDSAG
jgi:hypothetical protein